jgi:hypothetical protein
MPSRSSREFTARLRGVEVEDLWWPAEPNLFETVLDYGDKPYVVTVGFVRPALGDVPVPVEVTIRRTFPVSNQAYRPGFVEGTEPGPLSARDVRRLPLDRLVRAAAATADRGPSESHNEVSKILVPPGRPEGGERSIAFYKGIADAYREFQQRKPLESPAKLIARQKRVPVNTVHQWIFRARRLGFLEPSPRKRKVEA